jgi:DNA-binding transcriptional ArsR family regulator
MPISDSAQDRMLRAIADPSRRRILQILKEQRSTLQPKRAGLCASEVERHLKLAQSTVSHHLAVLNRAGLVRSRKEGLWVWYQRNEDTLRELGRNLVRSL